MVTYVMSDLHGEFDKYIKMLEIIGFSDEDTLFILGDVCDRGKSPAKILKDMMYRTNVYPIMGNHDAGALYMLKKLNVEITEENADTQLSVDDMNELTDWLADGGATTAEDFRKLSIDERNAILDYMSEFPFYEIVDIGKRTFILVHAGLGNFRKDKKLSEYYPDELVLSRPKPNVRLFDDEDIFVVMGHTPTPFLCGEPKILKCANNIFIDCGACQKGGRLACLCLDTMEEFYC